MEPRSGSLTEEELFGSVEATALWKVVTLSGVNRYTGSVEARQGARSGRLFFDEGRVVHAETGAESGEAAFQRIMRWPAATYSLQSDEAPSRVSITRSLALLLVDLKGLPTLPDATPEPTPPSSRAPAPSAARLEWLAATTERIRGLPGVLGAMLHGADGAVGALGPCTPEDEQALALGRAGKRLGDSLGLGRLVLGVARGSERLVLLLTTREHQMTVSIRADDQVEVVQAKIRSLLNPQS